MFSDQNYLTISEHRQLMVMEPQVLLRLEQESLPPVLELRWPPDKQLLIRHMQECHKLEFRKLAFHKLARSTSVRKDHILASGSSALEASTSASSALAMKALEACTSGYHSKCCICLRPGRLLQQSEQTQRPLHTASTS